MDDTLFLSLVYEYLKTKPKLFGEVIDAATAGVRAFADKQNDRAAALSARLYVVLENTATKPPKKGTYGNFSVAEVLDGLEGNFAGTVGLQQLREKFGIISEKGN